MNINYSKAGVGAQGVMPITRYAYSKFYLRLSLAFLSLAELGLQTGICKSSSTNPLYLVSRVQISWKTI